VNAGEEVVKAALRRVRAEVRAMHILLFLNCQESNAPRRYDNPFRKDHLAPQFWGSRLER
jgi:hypothetical protein